MVSKLVVRSRVWEEFPEFDVSTPPSGDGLPNGKFFGPSRNPLIGRSRRTTIKERPQ